MDWRKLDQEVDRLKAESLTRAEVLLREVGRNRELAGRVAELESEVLSLTLAIHGCHCPPPYDECPHDEGLLHEIDRLRAQLTEATINPDPDTNP